MPELPEVAALARFPTERSAGTVVERAEVAALSALKTFSPPIDALHGRQIASWKRWGKYLGMDAGGLWLITHLARGGWVQWRERTPPARAKPGRGPLTLRVGLSSGAGFDITEQGTEKRLALWVVGEPQAVDGLARLGPDPLSEDFDVGALAALLAGRPGHLKNVLVDQSALAGVGNAYSDEALHAARLSPFKPAAKMTEEEVARLHGALVGVLSDA
ncbi:MAG: DNA-formamidopyrimidine glycosylase family protein, partial [Acidimicrobiales bacterium]